MLLLIELLFIVLLSMILFMIYKDERLHSKKTLLHATLEEYWGGKERREHVRFKKTLEVSYVVEKKPHLKNGKTLDISEGGAKLLLDEKLAVGTIVDLKIALPNSNRIAELEGEVIWSNKAKESDASGKRFFNSGVRFLAIKGPSGENLTGYIKSLCGDFAV